MVEDSLVFLGQLGYIYLYKWLSLVNLEIPCLAGSGDVKVSIYKQTRASLGDNLDANWMREMRDFVNRFDTRFFIYERKTMTC